MSQIGTRRECAPPERTLIIRNVFIKGKIFRKNNKTAKKIYE